MTVKPFYDAFRDYISMRPEAEFRAWFDGFEWNLSERSLASNNLPATRHLKNIIQFAGRGETRLAQALCDHQDQVQWIQSYTADDFGQNFIDNYAHVELIGKRGHFASDEIAGGLVLFGPGIDYPDHWHVAEEIFIPITGGGLWSRDSGPHETRSAGEFIFHDSNMPHALKVPEHPLLALWLWRGGDLTQKPNT